MKRLVALLIMLFMVASFLLPFSDINNNEMIQIETKTVKLNNIVCNIPIIEANEITKQLDQYEVVVQEIQEKIEEIESIEDNKEWFLAYKDIVFKFAKWIEPPETIFDCFTEDEVRLICRVVETETYQCDFDSKVNVANVVINRLESGRFGDTVEEVITIEGQFVYWREIITEDTILAVMYAYEMEDTTYGALYFHSNEKTDTFCGNEFIFQDEVGHNFY